MVALAETGSGKTGAYAIPIIQVSINFIEFNFQKLMVSPHPFFAIILTPTRELAAQVQAQFNALGKIIGLSTVLLVGGVPITQQADLMRILPPHIVVGVFCLFIFISMIWLKCQIF